ncbi:sigma 54-interacting transcriptional regulator [bacterium]|nr:sigma 54-interacting transcriptional regulator [bacterium]
MKKGSNNRVIDGRYEVLSRIGEGGSSVVYKAFDRSLGRVLALKELSRAQMTSSGFSWRFKQEFMLTARLRHPHVVSVYDFGTTSDGRYYFTMDFVEGRSITDWCRGKDTKTITPLLLQVAIALGYIHSRQVVHGDIKPSNVMICHKPPQDSGLPLSNSELYDHGFAVLMDFGLSSVLSQPSLCTSGTVEYMAPERFLGSSPERRSDLYSVGVLFYEILSGNLPFSSNTIEGFIEHHLKTEPVSLSTIAPDTPHQLSEIVASLLAKRPRQRIVSAAALVTRLSDMLGTRVPKGLATRPDVWPKQLFGRDESLKKSQKLILGRLSGSAYSAMFNEEPPFSLQEYHDRLLAVRVQGASGSGKTAFLDLMKSELQLVELSTMVSPPGSRVLDASSFISTTLASVGITHVEAEGKTAALGQAPAKQIRIARPPESAWPKLLKDFADQVVAASQARPLVWMLDDYDLLDEKCKQTLAVVVRAACRMHAGRRIAIVLTSALGAGTELDELSDAVDTESIEMLPLDETQVSEWLDAAFMPNSFPAKVATAVHNKTDGLPAIVGLCIEAIAEKDMVFLHDGHFEIKMQRLNELSVPKSVAQVFESRISRLTNVAKSVLVKAAVLGEPFSPALMIGLGGTSTSAMLEGVDELSKFGLIVASGENKETARYSLPSRAVADAVTARLSAEENAAIHRLIAEGCIALAAKFKVDKSGPTEAVNEAGPEGFAHLKAIGAVHAAIAGLSDTLSNEYEGAYAFLQSRFRHDDARAITKSMIIQAKEASDAALLQKLHLRLGHLNFILGDLDESIAAFESGLSRSSEATCDLTGEVEAVCRLGIIYCGRGKCEEARELYMNMVKRLEASSCDLPNEATIFSSIARLYTFLGQSYFGQNDHDSARVAFEKALGAIPAPILQSLETDEAQSESDLPPAGADYLPRLFRNLAIIEDTADHFQQAKVLSLKAIRADALVQDMSEHARNLVTHGMISQHLREYDEAERAYNEALEFFGNEGFKEGILVVRNNLASILETRGRLKATAFQFEQALTTAKQLGNKYAIAWTLRNLGYMLFQQGWLNEAKRKEKESLALCKENGFHEVSIWCHLDTIDISLIEGEIGAAKSALRMARKSAPKIDSQSLTLRIDLAESSIANAELNFGRASVMASRVLPNSQHLEDSDIAWAHRERSKAALGLGEFDSAMRDISECLKIAHASLGIRDKALCLALSARAKEAMSDVQGATDDARSAIDLFKEMEAFLDVGHLAEYLSSLLLKLESRQEALLMLELARDQFAGLDMRDEAARLDDRIETIRWGHEAQDSRGSLAAKAFYEVTRLFESLDDLDELLNCVMDAIIEILGAERGLIMLKHPDTGALKTRVARNVDKETIADVRRISKSVVQRVVDLGKPIVTTNAQSDPRFQQSKSVSLFDIRSIVCVPLVIGKEVAGTLYVDSSLSATVFTKEDLYLLSAFATQASMAIENAMLLERLKRHKDVLVAENIELREAVATNLVFCDIAGESSAMRNVFKKIEQVADADVNVLVNGESGTGKELVARAIHFSGKRKDKPFIKVNCAAIPESLMENELFGHEKGAYTSADALKIGKFEAANGGSLFLDEIGDLPLGLQAKLLTAIENKEFQRVGGTQTIHVDVRILTATNKDLKKLIGRKVFRKDLFYRINEMPIWLAPLRQRKEDIPCLVEHFMGKYRDEFNSPLKEISGAAFSRLMQYDWPGNVRELESAIKRALIEVSEPVLGEHHLGYLPLHATGGDGTPREQMTHLIESLSDDDVELKEMLSLLEEGILRQAIEIRGWSIRKTAQHLGISRNTLKAKLASHNIEISGA